MTGDDRQRGQRRRERPRDDEHHSILQRIEQKLNRLLGHNGDDWREKAWAPEDSPYAFYDPGDPAPRFFGEARADAAGWDPSIAGPRFDRINVGAVGSFGVDPVSSYDGAQHGLIGAQSSAREYYIMQLAQRGHGQYAQWRDRKIRDLDREYGDYSREQQDKFDRDFGAWREQRKAQRGASADATSERSEATGKRPVIGAGAG
jgi:hypothetical protein